MKKSTAVIDLPPVYQAGLANLGIKLVGDTLINLRQEDELKIKKDYPKTFTKEIISFVPETTENENLKHPLTIAVVFSGGPAPGGHNVVCGIYYAMNKLNPTSRLIGYYEGFQGLLDGRSMEITKEVFEAYLNTGGFDMLGSSRVKIERPEQVAKCIENLTKEKVDALLTIGGDDSNSNAAVLSEHFMKEGSRIKVVGIPKTIDGDLKNNYVEQSFGFDTATTIFANQIGNICRDAKSSRKYWHIIKLMGRDTGHICLECALRTHPNIAVIGEEVHAKKRELMTVVHHIADAVTTRSAKKENFGVVIFSEGIVENCTDANQLLLDIDAIKTECAAAYRGFSTDKEREDFITEKLAERKSTQEPLFAVLPSKLKAQFMYDKDPHGHFQVALIESDQLLVHLVKMELEKKGHKTFNPLHHFFGYEGRCGWPTKFDMNYTFSLGMTGMLLVANGLTGYMSCVRNLVDTTDKWVPAGIPLTLMMDTKAKPRIKSVKVDLNGGPFLEYYKMRDSWKTHSDYHYPLPPQILAPDEPMDRRTMTLQCDKKDVVKN